jgi:hypothetical protein
VSLRNTKNVTGAVDCRKSSYEIDKSQERDDMYVHVSMMCAIASKHARCGTPLNARAEPHVRRLSWIAIVRSMGQRERVRLGKRLPPSGPTDVPAHPDLCKMF